MVGVPFFRQYGLRAIGPDRLALPLFHSQPADDMAADRKIKNSAVRNAAIEAEGQIAEDIEGREMSASG